MHKMHGVEQKLSFISFLDTFSFCCCSTSIKWISSCILCVFTFGTCNFHYVGFHLWILVMCITVKVVPAPWDVPVQSVHMDNSCPGYPGSPSEISPPPRAIPVSCERTSFQNRETCAHRDISGIWDIRATRDISPHVNRLLLNYILFITLLYKMPLLVLPHFSMSLLQVTKES